MSKERETVARWRDGGGGLLMGRSRKVEEPFGRIDPDDVRPSADLPDRDPRTGLTDAWRVLPGDRLVTFELDRSRETPEWQGF